MTSIIKVNTIQDAGGNALLTSDGSGTTTGKNTKDVKPPKYRNNREKWAAEESYIPQIPNQQHQKDQEFLKSLSQSLLF